MLGCVNLCEVVGRVILGKSLGGLGILGGELLAVTTIIKIRYFVRLCSERQDGSKSAVTTLLERYFSWKRI